MDYKRVILPTGMYTRAMASRYRQRLGIRQAQPVNDEWSSRFNEIACYMVHEHLKHYQAWNGPTISYTHYVAGIFGHEPLEEALLFDLLQELDYEILFFVKKFFRHSSPWTIWHASLLNGDVLIEPIGDYRAICWELENPDWSAEATVWSETEVMAKAIENISRNGYT
jgi:hypothetical protein